jgi:MFS family permease
MGILLNIPLSATNALGSIIAIFVIDKLGRRWLLLRSLPVIFLFLCLISYSMYLSLYTDDEETQHTGHILFFTSIIGFILAYAFGWGSTPWVVNSEIYPIHLIDTAVSLATATN